MAQYVAILQKTKVNSREEQIGKIKSFSKVFNSATDNEAKEKAEKMIMNLEKNPKKEQYRLHSITNQETRRITYWIGTVIEYCRC